MTAIADRYLAEFKAFTGNGGGSAPAWLKEIRENAIARFVELGFPTTKQEEWRFTSVAPIAASPFALAHGPRASLPTAADVERLSLGLGPRVVFVDGRYQAQLSTAATLPPGASAGSLAGVLGAGPGVDVVRSEERRVGKECRSR